MATRKDTMIKTEKEVSLVTCKAPLSGSKSKVKMDVDIVKQEPAAESRSARSWTSGLRQKRSSSMLEPGVDLLMAILDQVLTPENLADIDWYVLRKVACLGLRNFPKEWRESNSDHYGVNLMAPIQ